MRNSSTPFVLVATVVRVKCMSCQGPFDTMQVILLFIKENSKQKVLIIRSFGLCCNFNFIIKNLGEQLITIYTFTHVELPQSNTISNFHPGNLGNFIQGRVFLSWNYQPEKSDVIYLLIMVSVNNIQGGTVNIIQKYFKNYYFYH